ncbi:cupin domain-containing protein [Parendozoicomonas haliclonae]|uniref:Cupin domain protein n=1 Tax=Parendozoicomonas haliclonae TaxID=1960125 RepID=A0A1X7AGR4_9GAMM|nr:cupin domain-containing protein [Parendozoicomonas haliclonae]SMA40705.1 Cupin domain protein [Parendozoicomonas haliclonae]
MSAEQANLFHEAPINPDREFQEKLIGNSGFTLERIVSHGHRTPDGEWYTSDDEEWVTVLAGSATLQLENRKEPYELKAGDYLTIPANTRHRVEWTDETCDTVWLALHVRGQS